MYIYILYYIPYSYIFYQILFSSLSGPMTQKKRLRLHIQSLLPETAEHDLLRKDAAGSDHFCALAISLTWVVLTGMPCCAQSRPRLDTVHLFLMAAALLHLLELLEQPVWHARLAPTRGPKSSKKDVQLPEIHENSRSFSKHNC